MARAVLQAGRMRIIVAILLASSVAHADGGPPRWEVSTDWGVTSDGPDGPDSNYTSQLAGGVVARVYRQRRHTAYHAESGLFPIGGYYSARVGGVLGGTVGASYSEIVSSHTVGNTQYTTTRVYPGRKIRTMIGVGVGLATYAAVGHGTGLVAEGGFAMEGQHRFEGYATYDLAHSTPGTRITFVYRVGERNVSIGFRINFEVLFDFDGHPSPIQGTLGLAFGPGFKY